jgi:hypothetical protein
MFPFFDDDFMTSEHTFRTGFPTGPIRLADLRRVRSLSQEELAAELHVNQATISRMERRAEMFVSTLRRLVEAMGGELELRARFPGGVVEIDQPGAVAGGPAASLDLEALADVCRANDIERLYVFGSLARGEAGDASDVDLIADFSTRVSLLDLVRIEREFAERLGREVDLCTERSLSPYLRDQVLAEARIVFDRAA